MRRAERAGARGRRRGFGYGMVAAVAALSLAVGMVSVPTAAAAVTTATRIPVDEGVSLEAYTMVPAGQGPHPVIVFTTSWAAPNGEYVGQATRLVQAGYAVVSYVPRGFYLSGGSLDVAGPTEVADVSKVIDWTLKNVPADPKRIAVGGISYGAGIGLLAAGHDPRIRAVLAMSAWTDLIDSLYGNRTRHSQSTAFLTVLGALTGRPSPGFREQVTNFFANREINKLIAWGGQRSAVTYLDQINRNKPAIFIANAFGDSLFEPNQLVRFFDGLQTPKRLEFAHGDHSTVELTGALGLPNHVWADAKTWLDDSLNGAGPAASQVVIRSNGVGAAPESAPTWNGISGRKLHYQLGSATLGSSEPTGWRHRISAGVRTPADAGIPFANNTLDQLTGVPPVVSLPTVSRRAAGVWTTGRLAERTRMRGIPKIDLTVTPGASTGTVVAYLYDVDALGTGKLMTHAPYTYLNATAGKPRQIAYEMFATAYDVPAGHRLALVIDTKDSLYLDANKVGGSIAFGSPAGHPSTVDIPIR